MAIWILTQYIIGRTIQRQKLDFVIYNMFVDFILYICILHNYKNKLNCFKILKIKSKFKTGKPKYMVGNHRKC